MKVDGTLCTLPRTPAFVLSLAALVSLSVAQILATSLAVARRLRRSKETQPAASAAVALLALSWSVSLPSTPVIYFPRAAVVMGSPLLLRLLQGELRVGERSAGDGNEHEQGADVRAGLAGRQVLPRAQRRLPLLRGPRCSKRGPLDWLRLPAVRAKASTDGADRAKLTSPVTSSPTGTPANGRCLSGMYACIRCSSAPAKHSQIRPALHPDRKYAPCKDQTR